MHLVYWSVVKTENTHVWYTCIRQFDSVRSNHLRHKQQNWSLYPPIRVHMISVVLFRRVTRSGDLTSFTPKELQRRFESCRVDQKGMKTANQQMVNQFSNKLNYSGLCEKSIHCGVEIHRWGSTPWNDLLQNHVLICTDNTKVSVTAFQAVDAVSRSARCSNDIVRIVAEPQPIQWKH